MAYRREYGNAVRDIRIISGILDDFRTDAVLDLLHILYRNRQQSIIQCL